MKVEKNQLATIIACNIIKLRKSANWSQSETSRRAGITSAAISMIEKDAARIPSVTVLKKLAEAFHVSVSDLLEDTKEATNIHNKAFQFFRKFNDIWHLSEIDQRLILTLAKRLKRNCINES